MDYSKQKNSWNQGSLSSKLWHTGAAATADTFTRSSPFISLEKTLENPFKCLFHFAISNKSGQTCTWVFPLHLRRWHRTAVLRSCQKSVLSVLAGAQKQIIQCPITAQPVQAIHKKKKERYQQPRARLHSTRRRSAAHAGCFTLQLKVWSWHPVQLSGKQSFRMSQNV